MGYKVLYIGKSCKDFTHDNVYETYGLIYFQDGGISVTLVGNRRQLIQFDDNYRNYFFKNFKIMNENEYNKHIRKVKLKKISK